MRLCLLQQTGVQRTGSTESATLENMHVYAIDRVRVLAACVCSLLVRAPFACFLERRLSASGMFVSSCKSSEVKLAVTLSGTSNNTRCSSAPMGLNLSTGVGHHS